MTSISGKNGSENFGVAVFKEDTLVGELNAFESVVFLKSFIKLSLYYNVIIYLFSCIIYNKI